LAIHLTTKTQHTTNTNTNTNNNNNNNHLLTNTTLLPLSLSLFALLLSLSSSWPPWPQPQPQPQPQPISLFALSFSARIMCSHSLFAFSLSSTCSRPMNQRQFPAGCVLAIISSFSSSHGNSFAVWRGAGVHLFLVSSPLCACVKSSLLVVDSNQHSLEILS
jgi:hypothetical protein